MPIHLFLVLSLLALFGHRKVSSTVSNGKMSTDRIFQENIQRIEVLFGPQNQQRATDSSARKSYDYYYFRDPSEMRKGQRRPFFKDRSNISRRKKFNDENNGCMKGARAVNSLYALLGIGDWSNECVSPKNTSTNGANKKKYIKRKGKGMKRKGKGMKTKSSKKDGGTGKGSNKKGMNSGTGKGSNKKGMSNGAGKGSKSKVMKKSSKKSKATPAPTDFLPPTRGPSTSAVATPSMQPSVSPSSSIILAPSQTSAPVPAVQSKVPMSLARPSSIPSANSPTTQNGTATPSVVANSTNSPTIPTMAVPTPSNVTTMSPNVPTPSNGTTMSPTVPVTGKHIPASPFSVVFMVAAPVTAADFDAANVVTLNYLRNYLMMQFALNIATTMTGVMGSPTSTDPSMHKASYNVTGVFADNSAYFPTTADMDVLVMAAFEQPAVQGLLKALGALPASNPFSTTTQATYTKNRRRRRRDLSQQRPGKEESTP